MTEKDRPAKAAPQQQQHQRLDASSGSGERIRAQRWWDAPGSLPDAELLLVVRSMLAVERAVDGYRRQRRAA